MKKSNCWPRKAEIPKYAIAEAWAQKKSKNIKKNLKKHNKTSFFYIEILKNLRKKCHQFMKGFMRF